LDLRVPKKNARNSWLLKKSNSLVADKFWKKIIEVVRDKNIMFIKAIKFQPVFFRHPGILPLRL
jgi:hypothetical protein